MATHLHFSQVLPTFQLEFYLQYPRSHASLVQTTQHLIPRRAQEKKMSVALISCFLWIVNLHPKVWLRHIAHV